MLGGVGGARSNAAPIPILLFRPRHAGDLLVTVFLGRLIHNSCLLATSRKYRGASPRDYDRENAISLDYCIFNIFRANHSLTINPTIKPNHNGVLHNR
jgi:hypothetical protein